MLTLELGDFPPLSDTNVMITLEVHHIETVPQTSGRGTFKIIPVCENTGLWHVHILCFSFTVSFKKSSEVESF